MLSFEKIMPGSYLIFAENDCALLGCPPEILKYILKRGLPMPQTVILPDNFHSGGHSQIALEFPLYHFLFVQQGLATGRKFRLIGEEQKCRRVAELLRVTLFGPDYHEMIEWGVPEETARMLRTEGDYLAMKNPRTGEALELTDVIDFVHYDAAGRAPLFSAGADRPAKNDIVSRGGSVFEFEYGDAANKLDLDFHDKQSPPFEIPLASTPDHPVPFGATVLGGSSGFDVTSPTLGVLMWINGNVVLWDSPAWIKMHLRARGVATEMIRAVIVSHMHEDHCNFTELLMDGHRPTVITTVEIYHCLLYKLAAIMGSDARVIADSLNFIKVEPDKPLSLYGATFEFFYSAHSIPTLGCRITVNDRQGTPRSILFSGDTLGAPYLEKMLAAGALSEKRFAELTGIIKHDEEYLFMDGGGGMIHPDPKEFIDVDRRIYFNHTSKLPPELEGYHGVMLPGMVLNIIEAELLPPWYTMGIMEVMGLLRVIDHHQISVIFSQGRVRTLSKGEIILREGTPGDLFYFILSGTAEVIKSGQHIAILEWGDFFGEMAIIQNTVRTATVRTLTPAVVFEIPGRIFMDIVEKNNLIPVFEKIWNRRHLVDGIEFFQGLDASAINQICLLMEEVSFSPGDVIIHEGRHNDTLFIVKEGSISLSNNGGSLKDAAGRDSILGKGKFVGLKNALDPWRKSYKTVTAVEPTKMLLMSGAALLDVQSRMPIVKHRLLLWLLKQGLDNASELLGCKPK